MPWRKPCARRCSAAHPEVAEGSNVESLAADPAAASAARKRLEDQSLTIAGSSGMQLVEPFARLTVYAYSPDFVCLLLHMNFLP